MDAEFGGATVNVMFLGQGCELLKVLHLLFFLSRATDSTHGDASWHWEEDSDVFGNNDSDRDLESAGTFWSAYGLSSVCLV